MKLQLLYTEGNSNNTIQNIKVIIDHASIDNIKLNGSGNLVNIGKSFRLPTPS